jgi:hypothetical protein
VAGFDDLLTLAQPFVHTEEMAEQAGSSWTWGYSAVDDNGDPVDMATGFTGSCIVKDDNDAMVIDVPVTFPSPGFVICSSNDTDDVVPGTHHHQVTVTRTIDSARLVLVNGAGSSFIVLPKGS